MDPFFVSPTPSAFEAEALHRPGVHSALGRGGLGLQGRDRGDLCPSGAQVSGRRGGGEELKGVWDMSSELKGFLLRAFLGHVELKGVRTTPAGTRQHGRSGTYVGWTIRCSFVDSTFHQGFSGAHCHVSLRSRSSGTENVGALGRQLTGLRVVS